MQHKDFFGAVLLGAVLGGAVAIAVSYRIAGAMIADAIAAAPPPQRLAVIDLLGSANAVVEWPEEDQQRLLQELQRDAHRLAEEGFIVLTSDAVFEAPHGTFLRIKKPAEKE